MTNIFYDTYRFDTNGSVQWPDQVTVLFKQILSGKLKETCYLRVKKQSIANA